MDEFVENDSTKNVMNEEPAETSQEEQQDASTELETSDEKVDDTQSMEDMMDIATQMMKQVCVRPRSSDAKEKRYHSHRSGAYYFMNSSVL